MPTIDTYRALLRRLLLRLIVTVVIILLLVYGLPIFFQLFYPFIFSFFLAAIANPLINSMDRGLTRLNIKPPGSRSLVTLFVAVIILLMVLFVLYIGFSILVEEVFALATSIQDNWPAIVQMVGNIENWLTEQLDILPIEAIEIVEGIIENLLAFLRSVNRNLLNYTVSSTGFIISKAGSFTLNILTFFLSLYFIMSDFNRLMAFVQRKADHRILNLVELLRNTAVTGVWGFIKTQFILAFIAFLVILASFTLYGQEYALTFAVLLAIVDLIPLLGTIAVLLPWGIIVIFFGDPSFGVFLVILGLVLFVLRRITEPKVMGTQTGLHPLTALIGIYVGIQVSGVWGALLGPLVMVIIIGILRSGILDNTFADIRDLYHIIFLALRRER